MPEHRANPQQRHAGGRHAMIGGDAIDARVVLVGRTGQDARLRLDPAIELIRVRTGFDAVGELANPVGEVPGRTVVIVGAGSDIDERNGGDGAFVSAARRVAPDAVVLRAGEIGANSHEAGAYDGIVPPSASADELRELIHGPGAVPSPPPTPATPGPMSGNGTLIHGDDDDSIDEVAAEDPSEDRAPAASSSSLRPPAPARDANRASAADDGLDEEELALLRDPEPAYLPLGTPAADGSSSGDAAPGGPAPGNSQPGLAARPAPLRADPAHVDAEMKPIEPGRLGGDGDDVLVAAALGGRDILEPALGLIRARIGRSDVEFMPHAEGDDGAIADGVEVAWSGTSYGVLRIAGIEAGMIATGTDDASGRLVHHARWLGTWLALAEQHRRLRLEAYTDSVSGAWNRRYFDRFLEAALPHARQRRYKLTVLVFDLDNFKSFNDRFGHQAGDMILSETVRLLRSMTRPTDRICRIGGDEFAVVFYEPDGPRDTHSDHPQAFEIVADRFQKAVEDQRFPKLGIEAPGELTISGGLATFPWDGQTPAELLHRADELALASKAAGKNQITLGPTHEH